MLGTSGLDIYAFSMSDLIYPSKTSAFFFSGATEGPKHHHHSLFLPSCRTVFSSTDEKFENFHSYFLTIQNMKKRFISKFDIRFLNDIFA
jgi:hypothetical protein